MKAISLIWIGIGVISIIQFFIEKDPIYAAQSLVCSGVGTILIWLANLKQDIKMNRLRQEIILDRLNHLIMKDSNKYTGAMSNNLPEFMDEITKVTKTNSYGKEVELTKKADCGKEIKIR